MKNERKERELLLKDFKKLGIKNKRLEDDLKSKKGNPMIELSLKYGGIGKTGEYSA